MGINMENTLSSRIKDEFIFSVEKDPQIRNAFLLIDNDALDIHVNACYGLNSSIDQPYYIASIGKVFTSVIIGQMVEKNLISYEDKVLDILGSSIVDGLHTYKGINYMGEVTIRHLLNHTSGIGDYFSDKPTRGKSMLEMILESPYQHYSPLEIVAWSKKNIKPRFKPGKGFHYSDTGYHLLGLLLFFRAIIHHQIIGEFTLKQMTTWSSYSSLKLLGIAYGLGWMYLKSTPLLFPKKFSSFGHIGSIGSFMFYNPTTKTYLIGSVNRFQYHRKSMNIMFKTLKVIMREHEKLVIQ